MDADAESLPSINLPTIYGDWEERSLPSLPDYEHLDIDDMDIDAATALVSDSQASVSQIRRARRRIPMLLRAGATDTGRGMQKEPTTVLSGLPNSRNTIIIQRDQKFHSSPPGTYPRGSPKTLPRGDIRG